MYDICYPNYICFLRYRQTQPQVGVPLADHPGLGSCVLISRKVLWHQRAGITVQGLTRAAKRLARENQRPLQGGWGPPQRTRRTTCQCFGSSVPLPIGACAAGAPRPGFTPILTSTGRGRQRAPAGAPPARHLYSSRTGGGGSVMDLIHSHGP